MKVVDINSRRLFGQFYPPARERVPEGFRFLAGALMTFVAPTLAYCYVTNEAEPLYLMAGQLVVGTLLGISRQKRPSHSPDSCFPVRVAADAAPETDSQKKTRR